ncbi:MAG: radical SAM protein [Candidatus Sericytochromatia bacterium]|nr:radical SAM protein [Candidatus Tanganyikabacteria bacterium]
MKRQAYLAAEYGPFRWQDKPAATQRAAFAFPNVYHLGMSNLGFQLVWRHAHEHPDTCAERVFLPDPDEDATPLSLETGRKLRDFDVLAFALSYEQDYLNVLRMLDLGRIPRRGASRDRSHPLIIAGGPALWGNPEPVAPFLDAIVIGDGEEAIGRILDTVRDHRGASRPEVLAALGRLAGVYVPALYEPVYSPDGYFEGLEPLGDAPSHVERLWVRDVDRFPAESAVLTPHTEFADTYLIEIARGCSRACRFCMAGFITRPVRYRQLPELVSQVDRGLRHSRKIGLLSASVSDHPDLMALGEHLLTRDVRLYMSSIRADAITPEFVRLLRHGGLKSLTVAPEAGSERMRARISKHLTHAELMRCVTYAGAGGMTGVKFYVMVGLPHETDEDILAIVDLLNDTVKTGRPLGMRQFVIDLHPFVPKAFTPYQWEPQASPERFERIFDLLRRPLAKLGVQTRFDSPAWAIVQELLARGDRRSGDVMETALAGGGNLSAYRRAIRDHGIPRRFYDGAPTPWDHIASGMSTRFMVLEAMKAESELQSPPCPIVAPLPLSAVECRRCGVCQALDFEPIETAVRMPLARV